MGVITVIVGFSGMQQRVKEESSQMAIRTRDKDDNSMFEELVLDEGYETKFRSLFFSAQGEITEYLSAYLKEIPSTSSFTDTDMAGEEDMIFQLTMPDNFNNSLATAIGIKVEDFVEAFIMQRWLATKDASRAEFYYALAEKLKTEISLSLNKRHHNFVRPHEYW